MGQYQGFQNPSYSQQLRSPFSGQQFQFRPNFSPQPRQLNPPQQNQNRPNFYPQPFHNKVNQITYKKPEPMDISSGNTHINATRKSTQFNKNFKPPSNPKYTVEELFNVEQQNNGQANEALVYSQDFSSTPDHELYDEDPSNYLQNLDSFHQSSQPQQVEVDDENFHTTALMNTSDT